MTMGDEDHMIEQEFSIWKKNTPFLYDLMMAHGLVWPSLTVEWLPGSEARPDEGVVAYQLLLGSHTTGDADNYVWLAEILVPDDTQVMPPVDENEKGPGTGLKSILDEVRLVAKAHHNGEVNRARHCPQNKTTIATKTVSGEICLFNLNKPDSRGPIATLTGHSEEGYGLAWSPVKAGWLLSGSADERVCLWDTQSGSKNPLVTLHDHTGQVGDVAWHCRQEHMFASVGDDQMLMLYDLRNRDSTAGAVVQKLEAHPKEINCVAFHPNHEHLIATGSSDHTIGLFDTRNLKAPLHLMAHHTAEVYNIAWCPNNESVIASSAGDRRLMLWDLNNIGGEQASEDAEDGPPELLFVHGGHSSKVSDFGWNCNKGGEWMLGSVDEHNNLQIWTPAAAAILGS